MSRTMTPEQQMYCQNIITYLRDLVTAGERQTYTKDELLVLLDLIRSDPDIFDPALVAVIDEMESDAQAEEAAGATR